MMTVRKNFFTLLVCLLYFCSFTAYANHAQEEVKHVYHQWVHAIEHARGEPQDVINLYAHDAVLVATFSPRLLFNKDQGHNPYFIAFTSKRDLKCATKKLVTRVYGDFAINTGLYTFTYTSSEGKKVTVPARFTFVYRKVDGHWLIENHHSSVVPNDHA